MGVNKNSHKKRIYLLYALWGMGLIFLTTPIIGQSLFPGLGVSPDLQSWAIMFIVGLLFTIIMFAVKRWLNTMDKLVSGVERLALEAAKNREWKKGMEKDHQIFKKQGNVHSDKITKIVHLMTKCTHCPEVEV